MPDAPDSVPAKPRRSGSENRRMRGRIVLRVADDERAALLEAASRARLSLAGYVRSRALPIPTTRARRAPSVDTAALMKLQATLNRIGSNIHQLLKRVNFGETPLGDEMRDALAGYHAASAAIQSLLKPTVNE